MILGISYNVFDGEELLEGSIMKIRELVDYVSVVYQTTSNFNKKNDKVELVVQDLLTRGIIDEILKFEPKNVTGYNNEIVKRNLGLQLSKKNLCTHHMSMDADEFYLPEEFKWMKNHLGEHDGAYCKMQTYYKSWGYQLDPPEEYYVSTIQKIKPGSQYIFQYPSPVLVDPTRRMNKIVKPIIFRRDEIQMHHGSYIRENLRSKLENSSSQAAFENDIDRIVEHFYKWEYPQEVLWGSFPSKYLKVKQTNESILHKLR